MILGVEKKVHLIDFGAVQDSAAAQGATFTVVGTYGYAPIEQFGGRTVPASDLYALGATLIHLATGRIPADLPQTKTGIEFQDKVSLSDGFIRWIEKLTEIYVEDRFSSAEEALKALNSAVVLNSTAEIYQPQNDRITLNKSHERLEIIVTGFTADKLLAFFFLLLFFVFFISLSTGGFFLSMLFFLPMCCLFLYLMLSTVYLKLNQNDFVIESKVFNYIDGRKIGETSKINSIKKDYLHHNNREIPKIVIETDSEKYDFNNGLDEAEIDWLVKEIKDWLYK